MVIPAHELRRLMALSTIERPISELIDLRLAGHPLQYLEGTTEFGPLIVVVDERVLIPRPETEYLADLLVKRHAEARLVVDLGTGSGAMALFLKKAWPASRVIGSDLSTDALRVAKTNGERLGLDVEWHEGDLFAALPIEVRGDVDLLVANPPYVAEGDWDQLPPDVRKEPRVALVAGPLGTEVIDRIFEGVRDWLAPAGEAWIEIGESQGQYLIERHSVSIYRDQYGKDRYAMLSR